MFNMNSLQFDEKKTHFFKKDIYCIDEHNHFHKQYYNVNEKGLHFEKEHFSYQSLFLIAFWLDYLFFIYSWACQVNKSNEQSYIILIWLFKRKSGDTNKSTAYIHNNDFRLYWFKMQISMVRRERCVMGGGYHIDIHLRHWKRTNNKA